MLDRDKNRKKQDIIIDIGFEQTKIGISCDKVPRKIVRTLGLFKQQNPIEQWQAKLEQFLYKIFYTEINYSPSQKTVVLIENIYTPRQLIESLAKILFKKFDIAKLQFCLSCITPIYCTSKQTGIVISSGYSHTDIMATYEGVPLIGNGKSIPIGSVNISTNLRKLLKINNPEIKQEAIKDEYLLQLKLNYSSALSLIQEPQQIKQFYVPFDKIKLKFSQSYIMLNDYFGDYDNQQPNIAYSFLKMLSQVKEPVCFEKICQNVIFAGGIWHVRELKTAFKKNIIDLLKKDEFRQLASRGVVDKLRFSQLPFNHSDAIWIGASIASSIGNIQNFCLNRAEYEKKGFVEKIWQNYYLGY